MNLDELERRAYISGDRGVLQAIQVAEEEVRDGDNLDSAKVHMQEARGCYAKEDALHEPITELQALCKRLRGANREELNALIEKLEELQSTMAREGEYGRDELDKAQAALDLI